MANYALEEKIKTLSTQYIEQEAIGSLLLLLMSALDREKAKKETFAYTIHQDILDIQTAINQYILKIEDILQGDTQIRLCALDDCMNLKKNLLCIYENIYGYISIWNLHSTRISDEIAIRKYQEENIASKKVEWEIFYLDCKAFLESAETILDQKNYIGQLLRCIPLQMARAKYYDAIKQSLQYCFSGESEELIQYTLSVFFKLCAPEKTQQYGKYLPELAQWLSSCKNFIPNELSDEELNEVYTDFQSTFEALEQIEDILNCLFNDINSLILLFYIGYSFEDLTKKEVIYTDLYHTVCEMLSNELSQTEKEAYFEKVYTSLENAIEPIIDKAHEIAKEELDIMQKIKDFSQLGDDTKKILLTEDFIRTCYYEQLSEAIFQFKGNKDLPPASESWKKETFDAFLSDVQEAFSALQTPVRKAFMQLFLGLLPPAFTVEQTLSMISSAIENASTLEQKILIVDKIGMVFSQNGFQYMTEDSVLHHHDHCDHEHHHRDCEHNHHHHDCGHNHHHH